MQNITKTDIESTNNNKNQLTEPSRYVTTKELNDKNQQYDKNLIDYYIDNLIGFDTKEIDQLYRARENELTVEDYLHVTNPFKFDDKVVDTVKSAAKLKSYPLISPVIETLLSEYSRRPKIARVIGLGEHFDNQYKEGLSKIINNALQQQLINALDANGVETEQETVPPEQIENEKNKQTEDLLDILVEEGQNAIDIIHAELELNDKLQEAYNNWLTTGIVCTYKDVNEYGLDYEIIDVKKIRFNHNASVNNIEDLDEFIRVENYSLNQLIDRFELSKDEIDLLCDNGNYSIESNGAINVQNENTTVNTGFSCYHVVYKINRKIGILQYVGLTGEIEEIEVDDSYTLNKAKGDISISYKYNTEIRQGWRIEDLIYKDIGEIPVPREHVNTYVQQKLPYNGKWTKTKTGKLNSIVKAGLSYAFTYNYVNYKFEKILNKNKDKITFIPQSLLPNNILQQINSFG